MTHSTALLFASATLVLGLLAALPSLMPLL